LLWRLTGDEPNSLCWFLGIAEEELKVVLRLSKIYTGDQDNFSKNKFELLVTQCETDWTIYRIQGKPERFIRLGSADSDIVLPKDHYDSNGTLMFYPMEDEHFRRLRTKAQRGVLTKLLDNASTMEAILPVPVATKEPEVDVDISTKSLLYMLL
jgi:hypothetical protein